MLFPPDRVSDVEVAWNPDFEGCKYGRVVRKVQITAEVRIIVVNLFRIPLYCTELMETLESSDIYFLRLERTLVVWRLVVEDPISPTWNSL